MEPLLILIADDSEDDIIQLGYALRQAGLAPQVVTVENGAEALAYFAEVERGAAARPDLVFADLRLPLNDGLELVAAVNASERMRGVPVILLFGGGSLPPEEVTALGAAANLMTKPVSPQALRASIGRLAPDRLV